MDVTSHRAFFRRHLTDWHPESSYHSLLDANACEKGAKFRKYTFIHTDINRKMQIKPSPHDSSKFILSVDGQIRTIVDEPLQCGNWQGPSESYLQDGEYQICWHPLDGLEGSIRVSSANDATCDCDLYFGGVFGNPMVYFDDEHLPDLPIIDLGPNTFPILNDRFYISDTEDEMLQLSADLSDEQCDDISSKTPGAPNIVRVGKTINNDGASEYWIHTTSFKLENNDINNPLPDGGMAAMKATADAPFERMKIACSSAPRTFLNEDSCVLSENACRTEEGPDAPAGSVLVCGSPFEVESKMDEYAGPLHKGGFDMYTLYNHTTFGLEEQRTSIWIEIALRAKDQLRQRIAFALSQILVMSPYSISERDYTESFLVFYDIFVRNAFGNYYDILKEVTYSPLMAEMLTYKDGTASIQLVPLLTSYRLYSSHRLRLVFFPIFFINTSEYWVFLGERTQSLHTTS